MLRWWMLLDKIHRGTPRICVHDIRRTEILERLLEHVRGQMVSFTLLHQVSHDLPGENINDQIGLEHLVLLRRVQVGNVPGPDLPRPGGFEYRLFASCLAVLRAGGNLRAQHLIFDACGDAPPGAPGGEHEALVPGCGEGVVHRMVIGPAGEDSFLDAFAVGLTDPGGIGAVSLVDWVCCSGAWVDPVVPGRT